MFPLQVIQHTEDHLVFQRASAICSDNLFETLDMKKASLPIIHFYVNIKNKKTQTGRN
jgi:hypothetical protein